MFEKQELAVIHKALAELTIKGAEAPLMAALLTKVQEAYSQPIEQTAKKTTK